LGTILAEESDPGCQLAALALVGNRKVRSTFRLVLGKLKSEDAAVRRKAAATLGDLGGGLKTEQRNQAGEAIAGALDRELAAAALARRTPEIGAAMPYLLALGEVKADNSAKVLLRHLRASKHPMLRRWAATSLDRVVTGQHAKALKSAWRSESDRGVRRALEKILARPPFNIVVDKGRMCLVPKEE
jgi:HEAT repeat protein